MVIAILSDKQSLISNKNFYRRKIQIFINIMAMSYKFAISFVYLLALYITSGQIRYFFTLKFTSFVYRWPLTAFTKHKMEWIDIKDDEILMKNYQNEKFTICTLNNVETLSNCSKMMKSLSLFWNFSHFSFFFLVISSIARNKKWSKNVLESNHIRMLGPDENKWKLIDQKLVCHWQNLLRYELVHEV